MSKIVVLDPGHGGLDSGAIYQKLEEKYIVLDICKRIKIMLLGKEIIPILTRIDDYFVSLKERCRIANEIKADYFISVHLNADPDPDTKEFKNKEARGEEIWYYEGSQDSLTLAHHFASATDNFFPDEPFRGIKSTKSLYVLRKTKMPAILIECGFIDNSTTALKFCQPETLERIARLISDTLRTLDS